MQSICLPNGETIPQLGQGTWMIGDSRGRRAEEIATLREGIDLGLSLIDTAEMYGEGHTEEVVGEAIAGRRDAVFLVSKIYPTNATRTGTLAACERSLKRLKTDRIDLYLLHWRGRVPLAETVAAMEGLKESGKIRHWGVSNFDADDMQELSGVPHGGEVATNQVLYNLTRRGIEWDLIPWCVKHRTPVMAYSPVEQARLLAHQGLKTLAQEIGATPAQLALAWVMAKNGVIAIPKTGRREHLRENVGALEIKITPEIAAKIDALFPPPKEATSLEML
ncbi:MAG: aldo/keto reductase [Ancalomicrobiaceae bacterium]|nr:aldo/keto reductase [Ancalomicrobiaceae bacterium]